VKNKANQLQNSTVLEESVL